MKRIIAAEYDTTELMTSEDGMVSLKKEDTIMKTVTATLFVEVEAEFDDEEATEETVRYLVEQDLEDSGWVVNSCELEKL